MAASAFLKEFLASAVAAANGVEAALAQAPEDGVTARLALERLGDFVRAEAPVPERLAAWAAALRDELMSDAVRSAEAEARAWPLGELPHRWSDAEEGSADGPLEFVLQRRDETESLRIAVVKLRLGRGRPPVRLDGWSAFCETLRQVDARLAETVPRQLAEELLGVRVCIGRARDWLSGLADAAPRAQPTNGSRASVDSGSQASLGGVSLPPDLGAPSEAVIMGYVARGELYRYVEGYARDNPGFAEALALTIDVLKAAGELGTAFIPRRWRASYAEGAGARVVFDSAPAELAAADDLAPASSSVFELGALPGLGAEVDAELVLAAGVWTFTLEVGSGALAAVQLDAVIQHEPEADGSWRVQAPFAGSELHLRVEDASGAVFDERIKVDAPASS